jgi:hypothetical protein
MKINYKLEITTYSFFTVSLILAEKKQKACQEVRSFGAMRLFLFVFVNYVFARAGGDF